MLKKQLESYLKEAKKEINITYFTDDGGRFVGEMKGNKRNGQGIKYHKNGNKEYQGVWIDDKLNGNGIKYDEN